MTGFENAGDVVVYAAMVALPCVGAALLLALARHARRFPHRRRIPVLVCGNLLVFLVLFSLGLLGLEGYYRFWCDETDSYGLTRVSERWLRRHYHMNESQARDNVPRYSVQRTPGQRRITFLGDSFAEGYGVADIEDRFVNRVRRMEPGWEVHLVGHSGYDTGNEIEEARKFAQQKYQLDQVVLVYCLNDIADIVPEWQAIRDKIYETNQPGFLFAHSFFLNTLYYRWRGRTDPDLSHYYQFVRNAYEGPLWERQQQRLKHLRDIVEAGGGHLLVVTFPFLHEIGPHYGYQSVHDKLAAFWQAQRVPYLDLLTVYNLHQGERLTVNAHDAHPNAYAHSLAAGAIGKFVRANLSPDKQPPGSGPKLDPE